MRAPDWHKVLLQKNVFGIHNFLQTLPHSYKLVGPRMLLCACTGYAPTLWSRFVDLFLGVRQKI